MSGQSNCISLLAPRTLGGALGTFQLLKSPLIYSDENFDFIHGNTVLEHVPETKKAVQELTRVLKKGGYILVTVPNSNRRFDGHDLYHTINRFNYFSRTFYPKELESFFKDNSCEIVDRFGTGCIYHYPSYMARYLAEKIRTRKVSVFMVLF